MSEEGILLVAALAGTAVLITMVDLLLSLRRHRRSALIKSYSSRLEPSVPEGEATAVRSEWISRRLAAIQSASNEAPPQSGT